MKDRYILGIWDGHDAGAALIRDHQILYAINEERLSRRKLEVGFPRLSIQACLDHASLVPADIGTVAASTSDPAKTLTRLFPHLKEEYYLLRRRKKPPGRLAPLKKWFKYRFTELAPNCLSRTLSQACLRRELRGMGFSHSVLELVDHHQAHAATAAYGSGFAECLVLTCDGVGDGLSGSLWIFKNEQLQMLRSLPAQASLGIFFEHVTTLLNMRELEDEGKVMALANYAYPIADAENPLMNLIDLADHASFNTASLRRALQKILWRYPSEQFAFMAQRTLERKLLDLVQSALGNRGLKNIALAGGVFSNVKANQRLATETGAERIYVFPHMGDGGLALGAALVANRRQHSISRYELPDLYLGPAGSTADPALAAATGISCTHLPNPAEDAARLLLQGEIILWFQGRMEYGPRALGNRSILARPDDESLRERLNMQLKMRVWYQPFCPSMLIEDAPLLLHTDLQVLRDNRFMTMAFRIRDAYRPLLKAVSSVDGTCRPHFVDDHNPLLRALLLHIRKELGFGVVLNTSFNTHGEPIVCTPADALDTQRRTGIRYLFLEDLLIENHSAQQL